MEPGSRTHAAAAGPARRSLFGPVDHQQLRRELSQRLRDITEQDSRRWNFDFHSHTPLSGRLHWEEVSAPCTAAFYRPGSREALKDEAVRSSEEEAAERLRGPGQEEAERLRGPGQEEEAERLRGPGQEEAVERLRGPGQEEAAERLRGPGQEEAERLRGPGQEEAERLRGPGQEEAAERLRGPGQEEDEEHVPISDQENCPRVSNTHTCPVEVTRRKRARSKAPQAKATQRARITDFFAKRRRTTETKSALNPGFSLSSDAPLRTLR